MTLLHRCLVLGAIAASFAVVPRGPVSAQTADTDPYAAMLSYLDNSTIAGNALAGMQGTSAVNMASGNANLQANLRSFSVGGYSQLLIQARQHVSDSPSDASYDASASVGGHAYDNARGIASINQASGNGNAELNGVAVRLASQGIREATDDVLSTAVSASAGGQPPSNPHAQAGGTRSVAVDPSAMEGFTGVLQLNQVAGSGNATDNLLLLSAPSSSH